MTLLLFYLIFWALSCLCLGMEKQAKKIIPKKSTATTCKTLVILGYTLLAITLLVAMNTLGVGIGIVYCLGAASLAHFVIVMLVGYFPKYLLLFTGFFLIIK